MAQHVTFTREAIYRVSWDVEIPDEVPEEEWESYIESVLDIYNYDEDEAEFYEYTDNSWFEK